MPHVDLRPAAHWECPHCESRNYTTVALLPLCRDGLKALFVDQGAMTEIDDLPEDAGLATPLDVLQYPATVTCLTCGQEFYTNPPEGVAEFLREFEAWDGESE